MSNWRDGWLSWAQTLPSPNFGPRPAGMDICLAVIHNISLPPGEFGGGWVEAFFQNRLPAEEHPYFATIADMKVSAHFFIRRNGEAVQMVSVNDRAWHAGASVWQGRENCNDFSVGIELEGADDQPFAENQYAALNRLLAALLEVYPITALAGHSDIAPGRKTDPGPCFDWAALRRCFPELGFPEQAG